MNTRSDSAIESIENVVYWNPIEPDTFAPLYSECAFDMMQFETSKCENKNFEIMNILKGLLIGHAHFKTTL